MHFLRPLFWYAYVDNSQKHQLDIRFHNNNFQISIWLFHYCREYAQIQVILQLSLWYLVANFMKSIDKSI